MKNLILSFLLFIAGCANSDGTSTGNPLVAINFNSFNALGISKVTAKDGNVEALTVSNLKMCFKRLRFKYVNSGVTDNNVDLELGEVTIVSTGQLVTVAPIPRGTYSRIEFDLDNDCPSGKSIQLTNSNGSFSTSQSVTIRFDGLIAINSSRDLDLSIQSIISALNSVTSDGTIRTQAESVSGSY